VKWWIILGVLLIGFHPIDGAKTFSRHLQTTLLTADSNNQNSNQCQHVPKEFTLNKHKTKYTVGVLAIRGPDAAFREFNSTFHDYLTATAGARFDQPVQFEMKPLNFRTLFTDTEANLVDFIYVNPSAYSCIESEFGAHSLVSQISLRKVGGQSYDLTQFGGVIFVSADSDIMTVEDIKNRSVACASISGLGSGQMQFRLLQQRGLSYINDPIQMVFTSNQGKVVNGVLNGDFEVGYVRTDQLERTTDANGVLIDKSRVRILEPQADLNIDGMPFPFESSTQLYAEWNVAALTHVPADVAEALQSAMLGLSEHAQIGSQLNACYDANLCFTDTDFTLFNFSSSQECQESCNDQIDLQSLRSDTSIDIALLADQAKNHGKYTGWRTTISYMDLRNMQEETGFISKNPDTGAMQCIRSSNIYEDIVCPPGHFKKSEEEVNNGCSQLGLECKEGFQCVCKPCVKAFDVDVMPAFDTSGSGCAKMDICGDVEQTKDITFKAIDNKKRENARMTVTLHEAQESRPIVAIQDMEDPFLYFFNVSSNQRGSVVMEILVDEEQIPESPLRVTVTTRNCPFDTGDVNSEANTDGECVCIASAVNINGSCVKFSTLLPSVIVPLAMLGFLGVYFYVERKRKQADSVWAVKTQELLFDSPVEVIGRGTFGLVLLGEYRGTQVAVKRVIPPRLKDKKVKKNNMLGSGEVKPLDDDAPVMVQARRSSLTNGNVFDIENGVRQPLGIRSSDIDKDQSVFFGLKSGALWSQSGSTTRSSSMRMSGSFSGINKLFFKKDDYSKLKKDFMTEMRHLSKLRHPCITTVMGAVIDKREEPMLVMEYMDHGSLYDLLHNQTLEIEGEIVLPILRDIAQGVRFLHAADPKVVHGDLKAQNILVDSKFRAKVADFGLSQKKQIGATGTPLWMAPELLRGESENTAMSDVYSFGIILYEVYSRKDPYYGENHREVLKLVADPVINKRPPVPPACPDAVASIMKECLERTPGSRPTFEQLDLRLKDLDVENVEPGKMSFSMQEKKLQQATRSEELLFDVFPKHIAEAIRDGRKVDPESREAVTIFFSDIVGEYFDFFVPDHLFLLWISFLTLI